MSETPIHRFYVTCPRGLSGLLARELEGLGGRGVIVEAGGCRVRGPLAFGYRMCLWSRLASRVLLLLGDAVVEDEAGLYEAVRAMAWEEHVRADGSIAAEFVGEGAGIGHSQFGAQRIKDAVVDRFRGRVGVRPSVDREAPDLRIVVHARGRGVTMAIDLAGESLHRRGYRRDAGAAPIKENLAAAMLVFGGWIEIAGEGGWLLDPLCGSGTIVIEAAAMAADVAPGLGRERFGFERWLGHDEAAWQELGREAKERAAVGRGRVMGRALLGCDRDRGIVEIARRNAEAAGLEACVRFDVATLGAVASGRVPSLDFAAPGLVASNPPFGERMGDKQEARHTWAELGRTLRQRFVGTRREPGVNGLTAVLIATDDGLSHALGLPIDRTLETSSGPHPARLLVCHVPHAAASDHPFANRLRKTFKHRRKWAAREHVTCYRVYDADIPEYNAAIDLYEGRAHVQEYEAPSAVEPELARRRLSEIVSHVSEVLAIPPEHVHVKTRRKQRGRDQYERQAESGEFFIVHEGGHRFRVNLVDYLDTGLFLDHRRTRALIERLAGGTRFLNLFCYTGTATVYAAKGGAKTTTSVDLSNTYLDWARENLSLNGIRGPAHRLVRAEVQRWFEHEREPYDLVFLDPPTFSNSKAMEASFDIRRDHAPLIEQTMARVARGGTLLFSTNAKRFHLHPSVEERFGVELLDTVPEDFAESAPHRCWRIWRSRSVPSVEVDASH